MRSCMPNVHSIDFIFVKKKKTIVLTMCVEVISKKQELVRTRTFARIANERSLRDRLSYKKIAIKITRDVE